MDWDEGKVIDRDNDRYRRWIRESIQIKTNVPNMNRDEGAYRLSNIWDQVLTNPTSGGRGPSNQ